MHPDEWWWWYESKLPEPEEKDEPDWELLYSMLPNDEGE